MTVTLNFFEIILNAMMLFIILYYRRKYHEMRDHTRWLEEQLLIDNMKKSKGILDTLFSRLGFGFVKTQLEILRHELEEAELDENYERAEYIRQEIAKLEKGGGL